MILNTRSNSIRETAGIHKLHGHKEKAGQFSKNTKSLPAWRFSVPFCLYGNGSETK